MILLLLLSCVQPPTLEPSVRDRLDRGLGILKLSEEEISQNLPLIHHYLLNHAQHSHRAMILLILKTHHEQARSASAFAELLFQTPCAIEITFARLRPWPTYPEVSLSCLTTGSMASRPPSASATLYFCFAITQSLALNLPCTLPRKPGHDSSSM